MEIAMYGHPGLLPLYDLFLSGAEIERGEFKRMTGLGERTAVRLLSALLRRGLLRSDSPQGRLRCGVPLHALRFTFRRCGRRRKGMPRPEGVRPGRGVVGEWGDAVTLALRAGLSGVL
jgi:DNA-binding IclR family transcriptional regulator